MIKVIVSDIDGTLLRTDQTVAEETFAAVKAAHNAGIRFVVATSRSTPKILGKLADTGLISDYVLNGGAEVRTPDGELKESIPLDAKQCREIYKRLLDFSVSVIISTSGHDDIIKSEDDLEKILKRGDSIYKMYLFSEDVDELSRIRTYLETNEEVSVTSSYEKNIEITDVKAQKGPVLKKYLTGLGYKMNEIMVIGDSLNDYSMLSMDFGITVAMGNGVPEVKRIAKYVTKTNDESGVAFVVRKALKRDFGWTGKQEA